MFVSTTLIFNCFDIFSYLFFISFSLAICTDL
nr:MAG TPA: hypothetical protein [Caudoviricetes sp.]